MNKGACPICGVEAELTLHHLVPRVKCHNKYRQMKDDPANHLMICRCCHDQIHALFSENELRDSYNTLEKLLASPEFVKFVEWRRKHPDYSGHSKMSSRRR